ncbi:hypothetical protein HS048_13440 [Planomonospora sp. ID91781]|uniref:Uncharacterized protein n=1 Tax=Planomonospora sphaerica TaxID=161355 RepID=A0A171CGP5_9ACTN|nr:MULTISPECIES: hypothetical protein [Planomonospora]MBG0821739.1 hypothetical protein [Planomonospora sp. ID91781]GAT66678.1 hypothetical protein PS9374_02328 [Planomonospora sphaerica]
MERPDNALGAFDLQMRSIPARVQDEAVTRMTVCSATTQYQCTLSPIQSTCTQPTCADTCCYQGSRVC